MHTKEVFKRKHAMSCELRHVQHTAHEKLSFPKTIGANCIAWHASQEASQCYGKSKGKARAQPAFPLLTRRRAYQVVGSKNGNAGTEFLEDFVFLLNIFIKKNSRWT